MALQAVRSLRSLHARSAADRASSEGEAPPEELLVKGASEEWINGLYSLNGTHCARPMYSKVEDPEGDTRIYFHLIEEVWSLGEIPRATYKHSASSPTPPLEQWIRRSDDEPGPTVSLVAPMVQVEDASDDSDGVYVRCGSFNQRPLFKQAGRTGTLQFNGADWAIQNGSGAIVATSQDTEDIPPMTGWNHGTSVSVFESPFPDAPRFFWVQGAGRESENGCYACTHTSNGKPRYVRVGREGSIFFSPHPFPNGAWKISRTSFGSQWWYWHLDSSSEQLPPPNGWTHEDTGATPPAPTLHPRQRYSEADMASPARASSERGSSSSRPPFLVVRGAGSSEVNGRFACVGDHGNAPKYRQVGGTSIIFYESGLWRLFHEEDTNQRLYDGPADRSALPTSGWDPRHYGPAPTVSFGNCRDLEAGDEIRIEKADSQVDWRGCPQSEMERLSFTGPWECELHHVEGNWFCNTFFPDMMAPLEAIGSVKFGGKWHCISAAERSLATSASAPARAFATTAAGSRAAQAEQAAAEVDGGFDEEWCSDQDVERFRCCICMSVARDAMVHECGAVLFCEMCWVKCQADSSNCPVCREDGSTIVPSHGDRRSIRNLMIMCPNKCGDNFPLCEKEKHIKNACKKRQTTCAACNVSYDADQGEEHIKTCGARIVPCRLCSEEVRLCDMESHFGENPGKHIHLMMGLLDKVASLEEEVKRLKGEN